MNGACIRAYSKSIDKRRDSHKCHSYIDCIQNILTYRREYLDYERIKVVLCYQVNCNDKHSIQNGPDDERLEQELPFALFCNGTLVLAMLGIYVLKQFCWYFLLKQLIDRVGKLYQIRRCECGNYRHCNDDRIDEFPHNPEGTSDSGNDETEFSELGKAESCVDCAVETFPGRKYAECDEDYV